MSNEEIVLQIQSGNTALYNELWEQCRKLLYYILARYQRRIDLPNYIDSDDLEQCMYTALRTAVKHYDSGKPYKFSSYLHFHVMNAVRAQLPDKRIQEVSANEPVTGGKEEDTELIDYFEDCAAAVKYEAIELQDLKRIVRQAVEALPEKNRVCIQLHFFSGMTQKDIAVKLGYSAGEVHTAIAKGLYLLRRNKVLYALYE